MSIIDGMYKEYLEGYEEYLEQELKKTERLLREQLDRAIKAEEERDRLQVLLHARGMTVLTSNEAGNQKMIAEDRARAKELAKAAEADIETRTNTPPPLFQGT